MSARGAGGCVALGDARLGPVGFGHRLAVLLEELVSLSGPLAALQGEISGGEEAEPLSLPDALLVLGSDGHLDATVRVYGARGSKMTNKVEHPEGGWGSPLLLFPNRSNSARELERLSELAP